jgi:hypothetical protein
LTKKQTLIVVGVIGAILLVGLLVVGGIVGIVFYTLNNSEAATTARSFLKTNEKLKQDIGEVEDFGSIVTGSINTNMTGGSARLNLKVVGARRTVNATVALIHGRGQPWRVTEAFYESDSGAPVFLTEKSATPERVP